MIYFITSHGINVAAGVSLLGKNVAFCSSARYNFETCDFILGVANVKTVRYSSIATVL